MVSMKDRRVLRAEHFGFDLMGGGTAVATRRISGFPTAR